MSSLLAKSFLKRQLQFIFLRPYSSSTEIITEKTKALEEKTKRNAEMEKRKEQPVFDQVTHTGQVGNYR